MAAEIGQFALSLSIATAITGALLLAWRRAWSGSAPAALLRAVPFSVLLPLLVAFAALIWSFVTVDLSLASVAGNASTATPVSYRIVGAIAAPPSCLVSVGTALTVAAAALAAMAPARRLAADGFPVALVALAAVHLGAAFLVDEPFRRAIPAPIDGRDLDPTLQYCPNALAQALAILAAASAAVAMAAIATSASTRHATGAAVIATRLAWTIATATVAIKFWSHGPVVELDWANGGELAGIAPLWCLATIQMHLLRRRRHTDQARWLLSVLSLMVWAVSLLHATSSGAAWGTILAGSVLCCALRLAADARGQPESHASPAGVRWSGARESWRIGAIVGVACGAIAGAVNPTAAPGWIVAAGLGSCAGAFAVALTSWGARLRLHKAGLAGLGGRLAILWPRTHLRSLAHAVAAIAAAALFVSISAGESSTVALAAGEEMRIGAHRLQFAALEAGGGSNFAEDRLVFRYGKVSAAASRRHHPARAESARHAAVIASGLGLIAITAHGPIGSPDGSAAWSLSIVRRPLGVVVQVGAGLLALAGMALLVSDVCIWLRTAARVQR